jgi:hypothetical protein
MDVLRPDMDYFLTKYEGSQQEIEYLLKVSVTSTESPKSTLMMLFATGAMV